MTMKTATTTTTTTTACSGSSTSTRRGSGKWNLGSLIPGKLKKRNSSKNVLNKASPEEQQQQKTPTGDAGAGIGGSDKGTMLQRMSDRRLVKQISLSLLEVEKAETFAAECGGCSSTTFKTTNGDMSASSLGLLSETLHEHDQSSSGGEELQVVPLFDGSSKAEQGGESRQLPPLPAPLHRKELQLGKQLGSGGFSQVFAVDAIKLKTQEMKIKLKANSRSFSPQEIEARQALERKVNSNEKETTGEFAVKHLARELLRNPSEFRAAAIDLEREAQLLSCINHPNIIRIRGLAMGGMATCLASSGNFDEYFVVMDRLRETLDLRIRKWNQKSTSNNKNNKSNHMPSWANEDCTATTKRAPSLTTKIHYGMQLASALEFLHSRRLIFRDIKPPNIGFIHDSNAPDNERLQLFDFGLCRLLPTKDARKQHINEDTGEVVYNMSQAGSRRYLAPELYHRDQLRRKCWYNTKVDVYAWALTFYEILSQHKPYRRFNSPEKLASFITQEHGRPHLTDLDWYHNNHLRLSQNPPKEREELVLHSLKRILHLSWTHHSSERPTMAGILNQLYPLLVLLEQPEGEQQAQAQLPSSSRGGEQEKEQKKMVERRSSSSSKSKGKSSEKLDLAPSQATAAASGSCSDMLPQVVVAGPRAA